MCKGIRTGGILDWLDDVMIFRFLGHVYCVSFVARGKFVIQPLDRIGRKKKTGEIFSVKQSPNFLLKMRQES